MSKMTKWRSAFVRSRPPFFCTQHLFHQIFLFLAVLFAFGWGGSCSPNNIVEVAQGAPTLSTLVSALQTAGLVSTIQDSSAITVFAPTNTAFSNSGLNLAALSVPQLTDILTYHVLGSAVNASQLLPTQTVAMLNGASATITSSSGVVRVNNYATVTSADIQACNGVVHIVNKVYHGGCDE